MPADNLTAPRCLVAFATGWGSEFGGINVFNTSFLQHLSFACQGQLTVVCVVPTAEKEEILSAQKQGVSLVPLPYSPAERKLDDSHAEIAVEVLKRENLLPGPETLVWLGHDRITGEITLRAKDLWGGRAALIHHMSYKHYESYAETSTSASQKSDYQKSLLKRADVLFAIGPLLRDALHDLVPGRPVTSLVPGLDAITVLPAPKTFTGFMSGRLNVETAKIKQSHLGVAAFADAHRRARMEPGLPDPLKNQPRLLLRGVDAEGTSTVTAHPDATDWQRFAERFAGRVLNIQALPYTTDREGMLEELAGSTVALMPSWHEGFGLAGWEAIAAGVPLVLSETSGLHQLLDEESQGAWLNWVYVVDVSGKVDDPYFRDEDLEQVSNRLLEIAKDPLGARDKAARLREELIARFSWKQCVVSALIGLGWEGALVDNLATPLASTEETLPPAAPTLQERTSPLEIPVPRWRPGSGLADSQLLRAEEAAVPFDQARDPELVRLIEWAEDAQYAEALRLMVGNGGSGKTRLALELCNRLNSRGWHCGFFPSDMGLGAVAHAWIQLQALKIPVLAVFDYAETRQETIILFLKALLRREHVSARTPVRILLLARGGGEWWDRLPLVDSLCEPFLCGYATSGPFTLAPLHEGVENRESAYHVAVNAYAARLGLKEITRVVVDLAGQHFSHPLYVQMAALLALHGERPASAEGLTKGLINHERRYWKRILETTSGTAGLTGVEDRHAAELVALATLSSGFARPADAQMTWRRWTGSLGAELDPSQQRKLFEHLAVLYPGQQGLQALRPDLLGEALVAHALLGNSGEYLLDALLGRASHTAQRRSALSVIARLSKQRPDIESAVVKSLTREFAACAVDLTIVATQSESRLPDWAEQAFQRLPPSTRNQVAGLLLPALSNESVELARLACAVSGAGVEKARTKLETKPGDLQVRAMYAAALDAHAVFLARAGRDARAPARESVEVYHQLATKNPSAFQQSWARSLSNCAGHLSGHGEYIEAEEYARTAVNLFGTLAANKSLAPFISRDLKRQWAVSLGTYSNILAENGHVQEALQAAEMATQIHGELAMKDPTRFEPGWAVLLINFANRLAEDGSFRDAFDRAQDALKLLSKLASEFPDRYEPDLAIAVGNYSLRLKGNAQFADALVVSERAVEINRRLTSKNWDRFAPALASSLFNYASCAVEAGRVSDAFAASQEALRIHEVLAARDADRFESAWAKALIRYGNLVHSQGRVAEALTWTIKAVSLNEKLSNQYPDRHGQDWVWSLRQYSKHLENNGRYDEALALSRRTLEIVTNVASKNTYRFESELAATLSHMANLLLNIGQYGEALEFARRALDSTRELSVTHHRRFARAVYTRELSLLECEYLANNCSATDGANVAGPEHAQFRPEEFSIVEIDHAWIVGCHSSDALHRREAFAKILTLGGRQQATQFLETREYWLCAAAWITTHAPELVPNLLVERRFLPTWREFVLEHQSHVPCWMTQIADCMSFRWPDHRLSTP